MREKKKENQMQPAMTTTRKKSKNYAALCLACLLLPAGLKATTNSCQQTNQSAAISIHCSSAPSATFDQNERLWVTFVQGQHVYVSFSDDYGKTYSSPIKVNPIAEDAEYNGENRPKIVVDSTAKNIFVSWSQKTSSRFTGEIRFSRSTDAGKTFSTPRTINDDGLFTGHRFESLFLTQSGHLYLTWIDKRDLQASIDRDEDYSGAAVYYAVSTDQGASFSDNYRVADHSCECCRIAIAPRGSENVAILWRQIFGQTTRDHAIAVLTPNGEITDMSRASYDEWQINACPHHGPAMIQSKQADDYHMSWFSNGDLHQGIYYARYSFNERKPQHIFQVDGQAGAGHPYIADHEGILYLIWKGFDGQSTTLNLIKSSNNGVSWTNPEVLFTTAKGSDYPLIISGKNDLYLSWHTQESGYVLKSLTSNSWDLVSSD